MIIFLIKLAVGSVIVGPDKAVEISQDLVSDTKFLDIAKLDAVVLGHFTVMLWVKPQDTGQILSFDQELTCNISKTQISCQNSDQNLSVNVENLPIWTHIAFGSKNGSSYLQVDSIEQTLGFSQQNSTFLLHWVDKVKIGDKIEAEIQSFFFSAEYLEPEKVSVAKNNRQIWSNLIWGYHIFNDHSNYIGHQLINHQILPSIDFICPQYSDLLLPFFNNQTSKKLQIPAISDLQNLTFSAEIFINSTQSLTFDTVEQSKVSPNHKTNSFFRLFEVFSIYFESIKNQTFLRIVQEGNDENSNPILYDIVRYQMPKKVWVQVGVMIQNDGSYEVKIANQEGQIQKTFKLENSPKIYYDIKGEYSMLLGFKGAVKSIQLTNNGSKIIDYDFSQIKENQIECSNCEPFQLQQNQTLLPFDIGEGSASLNSNKTLFENYQCKRKYGKQFSNLELNVSVGVDFWTKNGIVKYGENILETDQEKWNYVRIQQNSYQAQVMINDKMFTYDLEKSLRLSEGTFQNLRQWDWFQTNVQSRVQSDQEVGDFYGIQELLFCPNFTEFNNEKCQINASDAIISNGTIFNPSNYSLLNFEGQFFNVTEDEITLKWIDSGMLLKEQTIKNDQICQIMGMNFEYPIMTKSVKKGFESINFEFRMQGLCNMTFKPEISSQVQKTGDFYTLSIPEPSEDLDLYLSDRAIFRVRFIPDLEIAIENQNLKLHDLNQTYSKITMQNDKISIKSQQEFIYKIQDEWVSSQTEQIVKMKNGEGLEERQIYFDFENGATWSYNLTYLSLPRPLIETTFINIHMFSSPLFLRISNVDSSSLSVPHISYGNLFELTKNVQEAYIMGFTQIGQFLIESQKTIQIQKKQIMGNIQMVQQQNQPKKGMRYFQILDQIQQEKYQVKVQGKWYEMPIVEGQIILPQNYQEMRIQNETTMLTTSHRIFRDAFVFDPNCSENELFVQMLLLNETEPEFMKVESTNIRFYHLVLEKCRQINPELLKEYMEKKVENQMELYADQMSIGINTLSKFQSKRHLQSTFTLPDFLDLLSKKVPPSPDNSTFIITSFTNKTSLVSSLKSLCLPFLSDLMSNSGNSSKQVLKSANTPDLDSSLDFPDVVFQQGRLKNPYLGKWQIEINATNKAFYIQNEDLIKRKSDLSQEIQNHFNYTLSNKVYEKFIKDLNRVREGIKTLQEPFIWLPELQEKTMVQINFTLPEWEFQYQCQKFDILSQEFYMVNATRHFDDQIICTLEIDKNSMIGISRLDFQDFKNGGPFFILEEITLLDTVLDIVYDSINTIKGANPKILSVIILIFIFSLFLPVILPCQDLSDLDKLNGLSNTELVLQYHSLQNNLIMAESQYKGLRIQKYQKINKFCQVFAQLLKYMHPIGNLFFRYDVELSRSIRSLFLSFRLAMIAMATLYYQQYDTQIFRDEIGQKYGVLILAILTLAILRKCTWICQNKITVKNNEKRCCQCCRSKNRFDSNVEITSCKTVKVITILVILAFNTYTCVLLLQLKKVDQFFIQYYCTIGISYLILHPFLIFWFSVYAYSKIMSGNPAYAFHWLVQELIEDVKITRQINFNIARKISSRLSSIKQELSSEPSCVPALNDPSSSQLESEESLIDTNFSKKERMTLSDKERMTMADIVQKQNDENDLMLELAQIDAQIRQLEGSETSLNATPDSNMSKLEQIPTALMRSINIAKSKNKDKKSKWDN